MKELLKEKKYLDNLKYELGEDIAKSEKNITIKFRNGIPVILKSNPKNN